MIVSLVAAGCGGDDRSGEKPDTRSEGKTDQLARTAKKTNDARTFKADVLAEVSGKEPFKMDGTMVGSTDGSRSRTIATFTSGGQSFRFEMMQFGTDQFSKGGALSARLPPGKEWTRSEDDTPSSSLPFSTLLNFMASTEDFKQEGSETIRGKRASRYAGILDLNAFADFAGPKAAESLANVPQATEFETKIALWIGPDDRPVRFEMTVEAERGAETFRAVTTMDLRSFGEPLNFKRPDPATVA